ncbi:MAG: adenylosuccinate lyase family protein [Halopenitus sp.]
MHTHLDGPLFRDAFGTPETREIFSQEGFIERFLQVEGALAQAEADADVIPTDAADTIASEASFSEFDVADVERHVEPGKIFSVAILDAWRETLPDDAARFVHWGATTQDISDTALVLQLREGIDAFLADLVGVREALTDLADEHRDTPTVGRTHHVHATPVTLGLQFASWLDEVDRRIARLDEVREGISVVECFGATGTLASLGEDGLAVQQHLADRLALDVPDVAWFAARDRVAAVANALAEAAGTLARIARNVLLRNRPEFDELREPVPEGAVGSSTMPHKRNPVKSQTAVGLAERVRGLAHTMTGLQSGYDERDYATWLVEFALVPELALAFGRLVRNVREVVEGLEVDAAAAERNLRHHDGLVASEAVMMALADRVGKDEAHHLVHELATEAMRSEQDFESVLLGDGRVTEHLSAAEIESLTDPENYTGMAEQLVDRTL